MLKTSLTANTPSQKSIIEYNEILNKKLSKFQNPTFLNANARQAFTQLRQMFTKASILSHFDLERHIRVEIDTFSYIISSVLS